MGMRSKGNVELQRSWRVQSTVSSLWEWIMTISFQIMKAVCFSCLANWELEWMLQVPSEWTRIGIFNAECAVRPSSSSCAAEEATAKTRFPRDTRKDGIDVVTKVLQSHLVYLGKIEAVFLKAWGQVCDQDLLLKHLKAWDERLCWTYCPAWGWSVELTLLLAPEAEKESVSKWTGRVEANWILQLGVQIEIAMRAVTWFSNVVLFPRERTPGRTADLKTEAVL